MAFIRAGGLPAQGCACVRVRCTARCMRGGPGPGPSRLGPRSRLHRARALPPSLPCRLGRQAGSPGAGGRQRQLDGLDQRLRLLSFRVGAGGGIYRASGIGRRCQATGSISVASKPATVRPTDRPATWPRDQLHKRYRDCEQKGFLNSRGSMPLPLALPCLPALPAGIVFIYAGYCEEGKGQAPSR